MPFETALNYHPCSNLSSNFPIPIQVPDLSLNAPVPSEIIVDAQWYDNKTYEAKVLYSATSQKDADRVINGFLAKPLAINFWSSLGDMIKKSRAILGELWLVYL